MPVTTKHQIRKLARKCVYDMGDIFWDFHPDRDRFCGYTDPYEVALGAVERALQSLADKHKPREDMRS